MPNNLQNYRVNNQVLTNIAIGYAQAESCVEFVAPTVSINQRAKKITRFGRSMFVTTSTKRAPYADHKAIVTDGFDTYDLFLGQHSKKAVIALSEVEESENGDLGFDLKSFSLNRAVQAIEQGYEADLFSIITNPANYEAGNSVVISAANQLTAPGSDPEALVRANKNIVRLQTGQYPTRALISTDVYDALTLHPIFRDKLKYTSYQSVDLVMLANWLGLKEIKVAQRVEYDVNTGSFVDMFPSGTMVMWYDARDGQGYLGANDKTATSIFSSLPGQNGATPNFAYNFILRNGLQVTDFNFDDKNDTFYSIVRYDGSVVLTGIGDTGKASSGVLLTNLV